MTDHINLTPLSDQQIEEQEISISQLWMIKTIDKKIQGPFSTQMLKNEFHSNERLFQEVMVYNLFNENWSRPCDHASFQRRSLKVIDQEDELYYQFYTLQKGQKNGPFSIEKIKELLANKELLYHDQISHDGNKWNKVYFYNAFDRRAKEVINENLPFSPNEKTLTQVSIATTEILNKIKKKNEEIDALAGLAFIGHGNDKGQVIEKNDQSSSSEKPEYDESDYSSSKVEDILNTIKQFIFEHKKAASVAVAAMLLVFVGNFSSNTPSRDIASEFKNSQKRPPASKLIRKAPVKPIKRLSAKKITPIKRERYKINRPKKIARPTPNRNNRQRANPITEPKDPYYDDYNDNYDMVDIEDPRVREELSREMAGDYEQEPLNDYDPTREREFIDQVENGELTPEMEQQLERRIEHYEEVSDFE